MLYNKIVMIIKGTANAKKRANISKKNLEKINSKASKIKLSTLIIDLLKNA